jgi:hypothetical protein
MDCSCPGEPFGTADSKPAPGLTSLPCRHARFAFAYAQLPGRDGLPVLKTSRTWLYWPVRGACAPVCAPVKAWPGRPASGLAPAPTAVEHALLAGTLRSARFDDLTRTPHSDPLQPAPTLRRRLRRSRRVVRRVAAGHRLAFRFPDASARAPPCLDVRHVPRGASEEIPDGSCRCSAGNTRSLQATITVFPLGRPFGETVRLPFSAKCTGASCVPL